MAVVERSSLIERIRNYMGEAPNDDGISILEDLSDSWTSEQGITEEEVKRRVSEVESTWRKKYSDRFLGVDDKTPDNLVVEVSTGNETIKSESELPTTYEELFAIERGER